MEPYKKKPRDLKIARLSLQPEIRHVSAAGFARTGFVDDGLSAADVVAVEGFDGVAGFVIIGHIDETETFGTTGFAVADDTGCGDFAESGKDTAQFFLTGAERQIAYIDVHSPDQSFLVVVVPGCPGVFL